jgi:hypothetical protein
MVSCSSLDEAPSARIFFTVLVVVLGLGAAHPCAAQQYDSNTRDRLVREASDLFKALDRNPVDIERCTFEREWDSRPVLAETAQRYLSLTLRADLVVSDPPASIMQIIDPEGIRPEYFCRALERQSVRRDALAAFEAKGGTVLRFISIDYSFPVFNTDYTRAALVVQRHVDSYMRMPDGTLRPSIEAQGGAEIYEKRGGVWQRIGYDSYYTAH